MLLSFLCVFAREREFVCQGVCSQHTCWTVTLVESQRLLVTLMLLIEEF